MRVKINRFGAIAAAFVCLTATAAGQSDARYKELPKFHEINAGLYRGAQPKAGGLKRLAQLGIKTIVDLRSAGDRARSEEREAHGLGLRYFNVPFKWYGRPTDKQVERVLEIINRPENQPVFVHCGHGVDRTGLIVAVYRITQEGFTSTQAKSEAKRFGMHWWKIGLKNYITEYYLRRTQPPARDLAPAGVN
jgi:protein tyrosine/serine phosphatase